MKKKIGLLAIIGLLVSFMAFSGVASAQASNVQVTFFESPTCSACKAALPIVQAAVAKYGVTLVTYDVTDNGQGKGIAAANGVSETPTIIISGAQSARFEGSVTPDAAQMEAAIKAAIGTATPTPKAPTVVKQAVATVKAPVATVKAPVATVKAPVATVKAPVATVKADPTATKQVTAVKAVAVTTAKQPTIEVVTANQTSTASTQTVPEFSLLGLGAPALLVGAIYLFLRRR
jgi:thiol-disulfide isomerase/thioredoxin